MAFLSFAFQSISQFVQSPQVAALVFPDPSFPDCVNGDWVQVMLLVAPAFERRHQVGPFQDAEVLAHRLARHLQARAQLVETLPVFSKQAVQKPAPPGMSQRFKDCVSVHERRLYATVWLHVKNPKMVAETN
jgi:hypothetical protein